MDYKYQILLKDPVQLSELFIPCNQIRSNESGQNTIQGTLTSGSRRDAITRFFASPILISEKNTFNLEEFLTSSKVASSFESEVELEESESLLRSDFYSPVPDPYSPETSDADFASRYLRDLDHALSAVCDNLDKRRAPGPNNTQEIDLKLEGKNLNFVESGTDLASSLENTIFKPMELVLQQCYTNRFSNENKTLSIVSKRNLIRPLTKFGYQSRPDFTTFVDNVPIMILNLTDSSSQTSKGMALYFGYEANPERLDETPEKLRQVFLRAFEKGLKDSIIAGVDRMVLFDGVYFMFFEFDHNASSLGDDMMLLAGHKMIRHDEIIYSARTCLAGFIWDTRWDDLHERFEKMLYIRMHKPGPHGAGAYKMLDDSNSPIRNVDDRVLLHRISSGMSARLGLVRSSSLVLFKPHHQKYKVNIADYIIAHLDCGLSRVDWQRLCKDTTVPMSCEWEYALVDMFNSLEECKRVITLYKKANGSSRVAKIYGYGEILTLQKYENVSKTGWYVVIEDLAQHGEPMSANSESQGRSASSALEELITEFQLKHITFQKQDLTLKHGIVMFMRLLPASGGDPADWEALFRIWPNLDDNGQHAESDNWPHTLPTKRNHRLGKLLKLFRGGSC